MGNIFAHERPKNRPIANLANKIPNKSNKKKELSMNPFASLIVHNGRQFPMANIVQRKGNQLDELSQAFEEWLSYSAPLYKTVTEYRKIPHSDTNYSYHYRLLEQMNREYKIEYDEHEEDNIYVKPERLRAAKDFYEKLLPQELTFVRRQIEERKVGNESNCCGGCNVI
jgi:hypothetical protein